MSKFVDTVTTSKNDPRRSLDSVLDDAQKRKMMEIGKNLEHVIGEKLEGEGLNQELLARLDEQDIQLFTHAIHEWLKPIFETGPPYTKEQVNDRFSTQRQLGLDDIEDTNFKDKQFAKDMEEAFLSVSKLIEADIVSGITRTQHISELH